MPCHVVQLPTSDGGMNSTFQSMPPPNHTRHVLLFFLLSVTRIQPMQTVAAPACADDDDDASLIVCDPIGS